MRRKLSQIFSSGDILTVRGGGGYEDEGYEGEEGEEGVMSEGACIS